MLVLPLIERLEKIGPEAVKNWGAALKQARRLYEGSETYLFHGTSLSNAQSIVENGFLDKYGPDAGTSGDHHHVYWAGLDYAIGFAEKAAQFDRPALLAAKLEDVLASGTARPMTVFDRQLNEEVDAELDTWQESLAESGCIRVHRGRHVHGLIALGF